MALQGESLKVAKVLWEAKGIQIDVRNKAGETPLMMAALKGEADAAEGLLAHGAAVTKEGWSPLHYAATGGSAAIVKLLLAKGAPLEARSPNGSTPLMMAARYGNEEAVDALLAAGADRSLKNDLGMNAAAFAASAGRDRLAARLKIRTVSPRMSSLRAVPKHRKAGDSPRESRRSCRKFADTRSGASPTTESRGVALEFSPWNESALRPSSTEHPGALSCTPRSSRTRSS